MSDFKISIDYATDKIFKSVNKKVYDVSRDMFTLVVNNSPSPTQRDAKYATGLLVNQWYPETNGYSSEVGESTSDDGSDSLLRIQSLSGDAFYKHDGQVSLTNNVDHAYRAEVLGWPSPEWPNNQGPYAMVAMSLNETASKLNNR